jgi:hypothetical protein
LPCLHKENSVNFICRKGTKKGTRLPYW